MFASSFRNTSACLAQSYDETVEKCSKTYNSTLNNANATDILRGCFIGLQFPSFNAISFGNTQYTSSELKGKVVLINLWFVACPPCVAEIPILNQLTNEFSDKEFKILSFALDDNNAIKEFIQKHHVKFEIFPSSDDLINNSFKMTFGYPTTIFLNKEGRIVEFITGGAMDEVGLKKTKDKFKQLVELELLK